MGATVILPDFILPSRANQCWDFNGIDSLEQCLDKNHFKTYPYKISYKYNNRGFRDSDWPLSSEELQRSVWCVGDSFTVGIGSPLEHTWVYQVGQHLNQGTINVSMDGASNRWITRKVLDIIKNISPELIIIQWSYLHRDEIDDLKLSDEDRRLFFNKEIDTRVLFPDFVELVKQIESTKQKTKIIHSFIPGFSGGNDVQSLWLRICGADWPPCPKNLVEFNLLTADIVNELTNFFNMYDFLKLQYELYHSIEFIPEIQILDQARDYHHYDLLTSKQFAISVGKLLNRLG